MAVLPPVLVAALVMGCGVSGGADGRVPVLLAGWDVAVVAEDTLELTLPSCLGQPRLTGLAQDDEAVTVSGHHDRCGRRTGLCRRASARAR